MRKTALLVFILCIATLANAQVNMADTLSRVDNNFNTISKAANDYFAKKYKASQGKPTYKTRKFNSENGIEEYDKIDGEWAKYKRWEWYWRDRVLSDGSFPDLVSIQKKYYNTGYMKKRAAEPAWKCINQTSCTGGYNGMGRTKAVAFHPTDPNTFFVGAPIGGIWKTTDGGLTYKAIGDSLPYVAAGTIVVDYANPNTIYLSMSDNGGWWNYSLGIYKTTDGGATWKPTGLTWTFNNEVAVYSMVISPSDPNILLIAASNGLWRTTNGGTNWTRVRTGAHNEVKFRPGDGQTIYAATDDYYGTSEVYRSTNAGVNWTKMSTFGVTKTSLRLAVTPANPDMLAVMITSNKALYVSKDKGATYTKKTNVSETSVLAISPVNENILYSGYVDVYQSKDGGGTWNKITMWYGGTGLPEVHADEQFIGYNPLNNYLYFCNDGGLYRYIESSNSWKELSNGLVITQYYRIATAQNDPVYLIGGTQDNGGRRRNTNGTWASTNGGDAMEVAVDPNDYNISYSTYCYGELFRTTNNWRNTTTISNNIPGQPEGDWVTPYMLDPTDSKVIVAGYNEVFRSTDRGTTWKAISAFGAGNIQNVMIANSNQNVIYASRENVFYRTDNMGTNWQTYSGPSTSNRITSIAVNPTNPQQVWITYSGYTAGKKVYRSDNGGVSWTNISGSLPNVPANMIIFEKGSDSRLYVGTDAGIYFRDNTVSDWFRHGTGLPNTSVTDLEIQYATKKLRAGTHGRGIWETDLRNVSSNIPPVVAITTPTSGITLSDQSLTIAASATDADGSVIKVSFFIDGNNIGDVTTAPYSLTLSTVPSGEITILARAFDNANGMSESTPVSVTIPCPDGDIATGTVIGTTGSWGDLGNDRSKVFDGLTTTFFDAAEADGAWVGLDMGSPQNIACFRFYPRSSYVDRIAGSLFQVANTADFSDAKTIYVAPVAGSLTWYCVYNYDKNLYRYLRFVSSTGGHCNVSEIEIIKGLLPMPTSNGTGLTAHYFSDNILVNSVLTRKDTAVVFNWGDGSPAAAIPAENFSVLWHGQIYAPVDGEYTFYITSDNARKLWINNQLIIDKWLNDWNVEYSGTITLQAGQKYPFRLEYCDYVGGANITLSWKPGPYPKQVIQKQYFFPEISQTLSLNTGYNVISTYVSVADSSIASLFNNTGIIQIKSADSFWRKSQAVHLNSMTKIQSGKPYIVQMSAPATITLTGIPVKLSSNFTALQHGFMLIASPYYYSRSFADYFNSSNCSKINSLDGIWTPEGTNNTLDVIESGKGYFMFK